MVELKAGVYRHYKGGYYQVLGLAEDSDHPGKLSVVYVSLTGAHLPGCRMRFRSLETWLEPVTTSITLNDSAVYDIPPQTRYVYVGQEIPQLEPVEEFNPRRPASSKIP